MSHICNKYNATVEDTFCSRRYKKALDNPQEESLSVCRTCDKGIAVYKALGIDPTVKISPSFNRAKPLKTYVKPVKEKIMGSKKQCDALGCTRPVQKEGLCYKCYKAKHGKPPFASNAQRNEKGTLPEARTCSYPGCDKYRVKGGLCMVHYNESPVSQAGALKIQKHNIGADVGRASEPEILILQASSAIVKQLLIKRQEHVAAVADIQETLRNLRKYAGVEIPEEALAI